MSDLTVIKRCTVCGYEKPLEQFRKQRKNKDGLKYMCMECDDEWNKKRYQAKRDAIIFKVKLWQAENPEKVRLYKRRYATKMRQKQGSGRVI